MPIRYWIQPERRRICTEIVGDFTFEEIRETISDSLTDPDYSPGFHILSDHRRIGEPIKTAELKQMLRFLASFQDKLRGIRWAIVALKPASLGMMNMLAVLADDLPFEVQVFLSMKKAEHWLEQIEQESSDDRIVGNKC